MSMEREVLRPGEDQERFDKMQMADWVNWLAPWQVKADLTFRDRILPETWSRGRRLNAVVMGMGLDAARKRYERFMSKELPRLTYFYALERNPSRDGYHVHALWADCQGVWRREAWAAWFSQFGRALIEPVRNQEDVSNYCGKHLATSYAVKGGQGVWWNVKLQWHRLQAMNSPDFKLQERAFELQ